MPVMKCGVLGRFPMVPVQASESSEDDGSKIKISERRQKVKHATEGKESSKRFGDPCGNMDKIGILDRDFLATSSQSWDVGVLVEFFLDMIEVIPIPLGKATRFESLLGSSLRDIHTGT